MNQLAVLSTFTTGKLEHDKIEQAPSFPENDHRCMPRPAPYVTAWLLSAMNASSRRTSGSPLPGSPSPSGTGRPASSAPGGRLGATTTRYREAEDEIGVKVCVVKGWRSRMPMFRLLPAALLPLSASGSLAAQLNMLILGELLPLGASP